LSSPEGRCDELSPRIATFVAFIDAAALGDMILVKHHVGRIGHLESDA
jgi:hypothetical protein